MEAYLLLSVLAFELITKSEPLSQSHPVACEVLRPSATDIKVHTDNLKWYFIFFRQRVVHRPVFRFFFL